MVNHLFIILQLVFLLLSEISWPIAFFDRFFPVLGSQFGLGPLGIFQALIGATILSHHVDKFSLVTTFFLFSVGCLNMTLGLVFREHAKSKRSIRAWRSGNKGTLPMHTGDLATPNFRPSLFGGKPGEGDSSSGFGFGNQGEKQAGLKGFITTVPTQVAPQHVPRPPSSSIYSVETIGHEPPITFRSSPTAF